MEMEVAMGRSAKKRTSEALEAGEPPPSATAGSDAPDPQPATKKSNTHSEETPPLGAAGGGEDGGGGVDHISGLPDEILCDIVSLLSTKDAAGTKTLASWWRHIWSEVSLNIDGDDLPSDEEAFVGAVSCILAFHPGPCRRFCIPTHHLRDRPATVNDWLQEPALDNLQELGFCNDGFHWDRRPAPPASAFRFSATLHVASFCKCHLLDDTVKALHFPLLRQLGLEQCLISESSLHTMISNCTVLESLLIKNCSGFSCLKISSNSLICLGVGVENCSERLQKLIVDNAPSLERLLFLQMCWDIHVSVIAAPKLETLGSLDGHFGITLVFDTTIIEKLRVVSSTTVVRNVKILSISTCSIGLDEVINLMKCFPCLEKLYIEYRSGKLNWWRRRRKDFIPSFDIRLKKLELKQYQGITSQVNFASFFLLNARHLELMRLVVGNVDCSEAFVAKQHKKLQLEKRASRDARLDITPHRCRCKSNCYLHVNHVQDLSVADPFECNC